MRKIRSIAVSLATKPRNDRELAGLVYALTKRPGDGGLPWHRRPIVLGVAVLSVSLVLNILFC